ncbi:hypothetical protein RF11_00231 [Thelohanellus kitauei]|uniref:Uncharacterized protein n=1 Tax=Thelohanellus kitauei TaxID=669202 RepID=A0A0C2N537_THEKT|nr:hypothetical protein RF11_00231 [Thelohanellus kitauei]
MNINEERKTLPFVCNNIIFYEESAKHNLNNKKAKKMSQTISNEGRGRRIMHQYVSRPHATRVNVEKIKELNYIYCLIYRILKISLNSTIFCFEVEHLNRIEWQHCTTLTARRLVAPWIIILQYVENIAFAVDVISVHKCMAQVCTPSMTVVKIKLI